MEYNMSPPPRKTKTKQSLYSADETNAILQTNYTSMLKKSAHMKPTSTECCGD